MPASAIASEAVMLQAIWLGSLTLSLLSLAIMLVLIARRWLAQVQSRKYEARKAALTACFYAALKSPVAPSSASLPAVRPSEYPLVLRIALDILRSVRGEDTARIVQLLELWQMQPYLEKTAGKGSKGARIKALTMLGHFSDKDSLKTLLSHAGDADIYVQITALQGLAARGAVKQISQIVRSLNRSGHTNSTMLADVLRRFGEDAVPALLKLAQSGAGVEIRMAAIMALGSIGSLQAVRVLMKLIGDAEDDIRIQSIDALGRIGDARAAKIIATHLEEKSAVIRLHAAKALGQLGQVATMPQLAARLDDADWWVRFRAAEALFLFGDKGIALLGSISGQQTRAGIIARQVLGEKGAA